MKQFFTLILFLHTGMTASACTNIMVTKGASADGSTFLVYLNDGEWLYHLNTTPAADHDTYTNYYFPIYCCVTDVAEPYKVGDINHYSPKSAWWVFNFAANYANTRYDLISKDIRKVQHQLENRFVHQQDSIEKIAL